MGEENYRIGVDKILDDEVSIYELTIAVAREAKKINTMAKIKGEKLDEKPLVLSLKKLQAGDLSFYYKDKPEIEEEEDEDEEDSEEPETEE
ncbi:MAG: hypothetical protein APR63_05165 [Desulfuromonas sp. SDB]|nr:MAG: hypothetical protein APR63_05165 [Desulfuromonas sp. SDB]